MESLETKKLALIRIWQILKEFSDCNHPMTQEEIAAKLENEYGIVMERKAIGRNISLLKEAGIDIESSREGSYIDARDFDDSELHLLIDGVLSSKHITARHAKDLIDRICALSNKYFRANVQHIHSVNDWSRTDNQALFYNIEMIDSAIECQKQICFDYNKYKADKILHKSSRQYATPYVMVLHNQRYFLMAYSEFWHNMVFYRLDHITNMTIVDRAATPLRSVPGYENGIDYKDLSSTMPYMYTDRPEIIRFEADASIIDQIIDWFGANIQIIDEGIKGKVMVVLKASPKAMEHWAMQYIRHVEVKSPETLRAKIKDALEKGSEKYR